MTSLNDEQLLQYGERSKGKVVLVTGAFYATVDVAGRIAS
jgi:NADPH-dependent curcumin reductase CurA